jgi:hypothetical protein
MVFRFFGGEVDVDCAVMSFCFFAGDDEESGSSDSPSCSSSSRLRSITAGDSVLLC